MEQKVEELRLKFEKEIAATSTAAGVNDLKISYLGKKGPVQQLMRYLKDVPPEKRPEMGQSINNLKVHLTEKCENALNRFIEEEEGARLAEEFVDVTLPGRRHYMGREHIITKEMNKVIDVLISMGFTVQYGPDIETDYYNFEALNFHEDHPARDMQDTFYIAPDMLLRTHTSNVQVRVMESSAPPIRIISPGKCYRNESITARSHVFFHQVEALYIDEGVTFADLLYSLNEFLEKFFGRKLETRFRPSYFPFVEPGVEVDVLCLLCEGRGCPVCKKTGWLEILGAGMVHPEVLKNGGIDSEKYTGYAWGLGCDRLAMIMNGVDDIRAFTENDIRFLEQFA